MQVNDLVGYNHIVRGLYLEALAKLPWTQVVEHKGLSFDSMRNVFLHLTLVEDRWISYTIPGRFKDWVDPDFESFTDMASLKKYTLKVQGRSVQYLKMLNSQELNREISVPWGERNLITVENALTHMVLEDMIHYGELSAAFWQMNLEPPYMGFWRY
jgi:uncharacterized damage-inducible protein DinB